MLNMALVDVGAGTSDISITKEGTITAYGMIPVAGDSLTDILVQHCLVEFETGGADQEKMQDPGDYRIRRHHGSAPDDHRRRGAGAARSGD